MDVQRRLAVNQRREVRHEVRHEAGGGGGGDLDLGGEDVGRRRREGRERWRGRRQGSTERPGEAERLHEGLGPGRCDPGPAGAISELWTDLLDLLELDERGERSARDRAERNLADNEK